MRVFHRGPFLILSKTHVQYELPDGQHSVSIYVYSRSVTCCVLENKTYSTKQTITVYFDKCPHWEDVTWAFEELAKKKYPKHIRYGRH